MNKYIIHGGRPLFGEVTISGAKNAAVAIIPAALLVDGVCRIENIPQISDVTLFFSILDELGARVRVLNQHAVEIDCRTVRSTHPSYDMARRIRASYYLLGALLGRFGEATVAMPGGCNFGVRPIDQHVKGFRAMGAEVTEGNFVHAAARGGRLSGANVYMDVVSVGATMNIMMAAVLADGTTTIENAAKEPHIVDLANFLNSMGADIKGAGTDSIHIKGVERLSGGTYCHHPRPDRGGYLYGRCGRHRRTAADPQHHSQAHGLHLRQAHGNGRHGGGAGRHHARSAAAGRCSGPTSRPSPTPASPRICSPRSRWRCCLAQGTSLVTEGVWNNRFKYVEELRRMGAQIQVDGRVAVVEGVDTTHRCAGAGL